MLRMALARFLLTMGVLAMCTGAKAAQADAQAQKPAAAEIRALAEQGNAEAEYKLGRMYAKGEGVPQDYMQAVEWFRKAADHGNAYGQNAMGTMYAYGTGVPQDYVQAIAWYHRAAEQGDMMAQSNLGVMYDTGRGVPQDFPQAAEWYRKAAEQGYVLAQFNLGVMCNTGQGVPEDHIEGLKWLFLAAAESSGDELQKYANELDKQTKAMAPEQVEESKRRALDWIEEFKRRRAAQVEAERNRQVLQLEALSVSSRTVSPGQSFNLKISFTATDADSPSGKAMVKLSFSILSGGSTMLDVPVEIVESISGQSWKITKPLTAATTSGTYLIRVRLALGATTATRDVEFEITQ
jgi:hypothetical protein